ncbi:hypothetical protein L195_g047873, partial [Trifolium pratense]
MVRRRVELAPCIKSFPNKGGQTASPVEQCDLRCYKCRMKKTSTWGEHILEWMDSHLRERLLWQV